LGFAARIPFVLRFALDSYFVPPRHQNTLKTLMKALGLSSFPGAASGTQDMGEFF